jgi:hypothetical protein
VAAKLRVAREDAQPSVTLRAYDARFERNAPKEEWPSEEFAILLYLTGEAQRQADDVDRKLIDRAYGTADTLNEILQSLRGSEALKKTAETSIAVALQ